MTDGQRRPSTPRVAVVIPCFNDGVTVEEAVASVLDSDQEECELIVVDDGSTDLATVRTFERLEQRGIRILHQDNRGPSAARTAGARATTAPYVFALDADDLLEPGALTTLADALDADPRAVAAWGDDVSFGETAVHSRNGEWLDPWLESYVNVLPAAAAFRRGELFEAGAWAEKKVAGHEDWDLWMAFAERGHRGVHVPLPIVRYRMHGGRRWRSVTKTRDAIFGELKQRHPLLFEKRRENKALSPAPLRLKLTLPLVERLTFLPTRVRVSLSNFLTSPVPVARLALSSRLHRARQAVSRIGGHRSERSTR